MKWCIKMPKANSRWYAEYVQLVKTEVEFHCSRTLSGIASSKSTWKCCLQDESHFLSQCNKDEFHPNTTEMYYLTGLWVDFWKRHFLAGHVSTQKFSQHNSIWKSQWPLEWTKALHNCPLTDFFLVAPSHCMNQFQLMINVYLHNLPRSNWEKCF